MRYNHTKWHLSQRCMHVKFVLSLTILTTYSKVVERWEVAPRSCESEVRIIQGREAPTSFLICTYAFLPTDCTYCTKHDSTIEKCNCTARRGCIRGSRTPSRSTSGRTSFLRGCLSDYIDAPRCPETRWLGRNHSSWEICRCRPSPCRLVSSGSRWGRGSEVWSSVRRWVAPRVGVAVGTSDEDGRRFAGSWSWSSNMSSSRRNRKHRCIDRLRASCPSRPVYE